MSLQIEHISIQRPYSYEPGDPYKCEVKIRGDYQNLHLKLSDEVSQRVIALVADQIVEGSKLVADELTREALGFTALPGNSATEQLSHQRDNNAEGGEFEDGTPY